jgi:hypothetical protein
MPGAARDSRLPSVAFRTASGAINLDQVEGV